MKKLICWWRGYHKWGTWTATNAWVVGGKVRVRRCEYVQCSVCGIYDQTKEKSYDIASN